MPSRSVSFGRWLPIPVLCLAGGTALAQTSFIAPDGRNRFPGVTIFCPSGTGVTPCNFGGGTGGTSGAVSLNLGGAAVSSSNRLPVGDAALDALISGGALTIAGTVGLSGSPTVSLGAGTSAIGSVSVTNLPAVQPISGAVSQSGNWSFGLASGSTVGLSGGTSAIGSVSVSNLPAVQPVSGSVGLSGGTNAIGSVSVSNLPATQAVSATTLPLPSGAATAAGQSAPLGPVAPAAATATSTMVIGCLANTTLPSFTAGQQGAVPCDTSGRPYVVTVPSANNVPSYLQAVSSGGATAFRAINAASSTMAASVKSNTGMVYGYEACNSGSATAYLRLFALGSVPTAGSSTPAITKLLPAGLCQNVGIDIGLVFPGGIGIDVTSGSMADSDSVGVPTANTVAVEVYYK